LLGLRDRPSTTVLYKIVNKIVCRGEQVLKYGVNTIQYVVGLFVALALNRLRLSGYVLVRSLCRQMLSSKLWLSKGYPQHTIVERVMACLNAHLSWMSASLSA
jgi:hypothetical protein